MKRTLFGTVAAGIMIFGTFAAPLPPAANAQGFNLNEPSQTITFSRYSFKTKHLHNKRKLSPQVKSIPITNLLLANQDPLLKRLYTISLMIIRSYPTARFGMH